MKEHPGHGTVHITRHLGHLIVGIAVFAALTLLAGSVTAKSQSPYPISELGGCRDVSECYLYCEIPEHQAACWSYGKYILRTPKVLGITEERAKAEFGITFPVVELGGCTDVETCRTYCENPVNYPACQDFGTAHGLGAYKDDHDMLEEAKKKLGCSTPDECRAYCSAEANWNQCADFGANHAPPKIREEFRKRRAVFEGAANELGCTDFPSCKAVCENPSMRDACFKFLDRELPDAAQHARRQSEAFVERAKEIAGCQSAEECFAVCDNPANRDRCDALARSITERPIGDERGEGGECSTEAECRERCAREPGRCPGFPNAPGFSPLPPEFTPHEGPFYPGAGQSPQPFVPRSDHRGPSGRYHEMQGPSGNVSPGPQGSFGSPRQEPYGGGGYPSGGYRGSEPPETHDGGSGGYSGDSGGGYSGGDSGGYSY